MSKAKTVKEVLIAGRWILENVGWCQQSYYKTKAGDERFNIEEATLYGDVGCACAIGSIYLVDVSDPNLHGKAVAALEKIADVSNLANWNDAPGRTRKEVVKLFSKGINKAE